MKKEKINGIWTLAFSLALSGIYQYIIHKLVFLNMPDYIDIIGPGLHYAVHHQGYL